MALELDRYPVIDYDVEVPVDWSVNATNLSLIHI